MPKKIKMYDPPEGWKYGFPKPYLPSKGESFHAILIRDGYPEKLLSLADQATRFWETSVEYNLRIIFCGDRYWKYESPIELVMRSIKDNLGTFTVIEGEAPGADLLSKKVASRLNLPYVPCKADWKKHGKAAGPIRNTFMLKDQKADGVVAFHHDLSKSKGTRNMVEQALKAGKPVYIVTEGMDKLGMFIRELKKIKLKAEEE